MGKLLLSALIFTLVLPFTVLWLVPHYVIGLRRHPLDWYAWPSWTGLALLLLGAGIYLWCAWEFISYGEGTPAPWRSPKKLVIRGLYAVTANPMYVGIVLAIAGQAIAWKSWPAGIYAVLIWFAFHMRVVTQEEPILLGRYGESYREYWKRVPRWFPGLPQKLGQPKVHPHARRRQSAA